jgi:hypothetical protein
LRSLYIEKPEKMSGPVKKGARYMKKKLIIIIFGTAFFTYLLMGNYINSSAFLFGVSLCVLIAIILVDFEKLKEIDLKSLRLVLNDIKEESQELQELALRVCELIAMNSEFQNRWGTEEWEKMRKEIESLGLKKILLLIKDDKAEGKIFRYKKLFEKIDAIEKFEKNGDKNHMITEELKKHLDLLKGEVRTELH